jgi:two-component system, OmpR family, response regulator
MNRVLLVEDERITSLELGSFLEDEGFEVEAAYSGDGALGAINRLPPRFLVTNLQLGPGPNGLDVARYARALRPDIRVVFVSGGPACASETGSGGVESQFIAKPFRSEQVVEALRCSFPVH